LNFTEDTDLKQNEVKTFIANLEIVEHLDEQGEPIELGPVIKNKDEIAFLNDNFVCVS
jgi:hypothetical protein